MSLLCADKKKLGKGEPVLMPSGIVRLEFAPEVQADWDWGDSTASTLGRLAEADTIYIMRSGSLNGSGPWADSPEDCELKPAAYFQACLDTVDEACIDPDNWTLSCTVDADYCS